MSDWTCCGATKPEGFTYHQFVTVCDTCLTQFPYYECFCELVHEDCNEATRLRNIAYRETAGINIQINTLIDAMVDSEKCLFHNSDANLMVNSLNNDCPVNGTVTLT